MPIITMDIIEQGKTKNGGYTKKQLEILGVQWPPVKGWKTNIKKNPIIISKEKLNEFLELGKM